MNSLRPFDLPPWYKLKAASFFRLVAASGYPPPEEQMAYFRLALALLEQAADETLSLYPGDSSRPDILAEEGLVLAEMTLVNPKESSYLLKRAEDLWLEADRLESGKSHYARARWAAWQDDLQALKVYLRHEAKSQGFFLGWPSWKEIRFEPSFRKHARESWFKAAWFGYSR
jgi:hypothetical protein